MKAWAIKDWKKLFEQGDLKRAERVKVWHYVPIPIRLGGESYRKLMRTKPGRDAFSVFISLCEVAANMPVRGVLADERGALEVESIEIRTGIPEQAIETAVEMLADPKVGWLISVEVADPPRTNSASPRSESALEENSQPQPSQTEPPGLLNTPEFAAAWRTYSDMRRGRWGEELHPSMVRALWQRMATWGLERAMAALAVSTERGWKSVHEESDHAHGHSVAGGGSTAGGGSSGAEGRGRPAHAGGPKRRRGFAEPDTPLPIVAPPAQ